jgi:ZIP family zinc transporter
VGKIQTAFLLTLFAGLATGIGSLLVYFFKELKVKYLVFSLGLSAGVMVYVSYMEMLPQAIEGIGQGKTVLFFFIGIIVMAAIDNLIPEYENPHEMSIETKSPDTVKASSLYRMGAFSALAIAIHNFPEGLAVFTSALNNTNVGIAIAVAVAVHNIPEGIAVSMPIYYATGSRKKAFWYSVLSGISEPIGAVIGFLIIKSFLNSSLAGILMAAVSGIMVYIAIDEILPHAHRYKGYSHLAIIGFVIGNAVMALTLLMLG